MFGKDKVKAHNRVVKGKSGFKVIRVKDFLRKEDDNKKRNLAIGTAAVIGAGGVALLLRKKGVGVNSIKNGLKGATANTPKYPKGTNIKNKASEMVVDVKATKSFDKIADPWQGTYAPSSDPWKTPIKTKLESKDFLRGENTSEMLVKPKSAGVKLLTPAKNPVRSNMKRKDKLVVSSKEKVLSSVVNMRNTQRNYDSLPLDMKVTVQMEKLLRRPTKISNLGRPPESTGLKVILDEGNKTPLDKVISKAKRKVGDRLKREAEIAIKKESLVKKNSMMI